MNHSPYLLFHQSPEQLRRIGARGGQAPARNQRDRRRARTANNPTHLLASQARPQQTAAQAIAALDAQFPEKLVEDKANGPALIAMLSDQVPGIVPIRPDGTKTSRAHAVSSLIEAGNVVLPHPSIAPWIDAFVDECASFPKGAHDDQVDCCTQALKALQVGWGQIQTLYCELDEDEYRVHISPY